MKHQCLSLGRSEFLESVRMVGMKGRYHEGGASVMESTILDLGGDLSGFLAALGQPVERTEPASRQQPTPAAARDSSTGKRPPGGRGNA